MPYSDSERNPKYIEIIKGYKINSSTTPFLPPVSRYYSPL